MSGGAHQRRPVDADDLHQRTLVLDGHVDLILPTSLPGYRLPDGSTRADFDKLIRGGVDALVLSVAAGPGPRDGEGVRAARAEADAKLAMIRSLLDVHPHELGLALGADDVAALHRSGRMAVIIGFQNARIVGDDLSRLGDFFDAGARVFAFCHAGHNSFADSARPLGGPAAEHGGLSALGHEGVRWLNDRGALIDVSQLSKEALLQTVALTRAPVVASHAAVLALNDIARNLSDEELDAVAATGGVVMMTPFPGYLKPMTDRQRANVRTARRRHGLPPDFTYPADNIDMLSEAQLHALVTDMQKALVIEADLADYVDHIDYVVKRIGIEHVGIGTDFNHGAGIRGFDSLAEAPNLTRALLARGYSEGAISAIWSANFLGSAP